MKEGTKNAIHYVYHKDSETIDTGDEDHLDVHCVDCLKLDL